MTDILRIMLNALLAVCLCHLVVWFIAWDISFLWEWDMAARSLVLLTMFCLALIFEIKR